MNAVRLLGYALPAPGTHQRPTDHCPDTALTQFAGDEDGVFLGYVLDRELDLPGSCRDHEGTCPVRMAGRTLIAVVDGFSYLSKELPKFPFCHAQW